MAKEPKPEGYQNFESLTQRLLAVSKGSLDRQVARYNEKKKPKAAKRRKK